MMAENKRNLKKQRSEQRRLLAVEETRKRFKHRLKSFVSTCKGSHIVFESDSDVDSPHMSVYSDHERFQQQRHTEKKNEDVEKVLMSEKRLDRTHTYKITGKVADEWLGFGNNNDNDNDNESSTSSTSDGRSSGDDDLIPIRPQFEGKRGEKLMKLQQRVGQDRRFEVTRAFLDESESENEDKFESDDRDEYEREKNMSLAVLHSVVGSSKACLAKSKSNKQAISMKRFDPRDDKCAELEVKHQTISETEDSQAVRQPDTRQVVTNCPLVSTERFFQVNSDLQFSGDTGSHKFSFLETLKKSTGNFETDAVNMTLDREKSSMNARRVMKQQVSSSDEESEINDDHQAVLEDEAHEIMDKNDSDVNADEGFFFSFDSIGDFRGRLASGVIQFMRTKSIEEIESMWKLNRKTLTQDYKKKRKDALRRIRKSNHHQSTNK
ncbi:nucleolar protein 8-like [Corticium candelabrum]|uniref:nucleolar protein 8-like n=1 Tax=Corticium candelabrum TaxID=121492 RepID=UPI002E36AF60|nr:nucleolar protein 8-like [Corticium candelabrum]